MDPDMALGSNLGPDDNMSLIGCAGHLDLYGSLGEEFLDTNMGTHGNSDPRHLKGIW